ncbi:transcriptional regulator NrdR family protein [Clostridium tetanomorphum]|uniref:ATP-cone domain-containing protein n=1 Tax=Clostridium tetanomorphum TaxID=1553 RepID=A0A923E953_CLOTT|nr:ATP cone domain-containing protein [Clostridium tetanomorphum]KAJ51287.1 putative anaerobic ribonucleoside-triphosphate reductase [Clostridium tetanomorphum DSM 665]MBC2397537.1 hypothetical protein [Clostridium tetanomorphum]MBP1863634.1 transcriptional regulator NrdR family protein [Clostridium tetanomorphum]NRS86210.1 transcriptional regulator NrdR family protein [Clostridium tetanomorphum]NRZ95711.1 transcriptional regulator NrdR family protein [Clostridium tetanomorphum]
MEILKKKGNIEKFNEDKLKTSILNAARDSDNPLNESDINSISKDIVDTLKKLNKNYTSSYEIFGITVNSLKKNGFKNIAKQYANHSIDV